ncbi:hypothetical protein HQ571_05635 [Candidatus Kuenenbacteria bacterium]|nr:hypothetical protein [Candidatus Kuenenbacteria bacterium]
MRNGLRVRVAKLESARGMLVHGRHLSVREVGVTGTIQGHVPGHAGDVLWVEHDNSDDVGAYCSTEIEKV